MPQDKNHQPSILDRVIASVAPGYAVKRMHSKRLLELSGYYRSASKSRLRANWINSGNADATPPSWELSALRARSRDSNRNDPIAAGITETLKLNILGAGLRPQSHLRADVLGITRERARVLQKQVETIFATWSKQADSACMLNFDEIQLLAITKIIEDGEIIAIPTWSKEPWRNLSRSIELVESDRLENPARNTTAINGIEFGAMGQPTKYWIRDMATKVQASQTWTPIPARDRDGLPKILHVYPTKRVGQTRGVPFLAPVLSFLKDMADYLEAEVVAARVAACLAVFITKADPMASAFNMATGTESETNARIQGIEPGQVGYLNPGEAINVVDPKRPGDTFPSFIETMYRIIGGATNIPYELIAHDFSKTNYSSARASLLEGRRMFNQWRGWFGDRFCQPILEMVLEEAWLRGQFEAPDFYKFKSELCRVQWLGGGWGWVDPVKEIQASTDAITNNLSTLSEEAANQGRDWEEILEQRAIEKDKLEELGLNIDLSPDANAPVGATGRSPEKPAKSPKAPDQAPEDPDDEEI
jgi:lambda family phage portal protein